MKRLLILARHYPPAISGGARRPFLLARELRRQGVDVRVCAPSLPDGEPGWATPHPNRDPATSSGPPAFDLRNIARDLLLWPDPDIRWCQRAAQSAAEHARAEGWRPDWVLSTSPPESIHVAGRSLAASLGARWIADFRDHWLANPHRHERRRIHRQIGERLQASQLLKAADIVLAVDDNIAHEMRTLGGASVHVLPHFAPDIDPEPVALDPQHINIVHAGSIALSDPDASITDLLIPFAEAAAARPQLRLHLVGRLSDAEQAAVSASPAAHAITIHGPVQYERALGMMAAADGLALVASGKMHVPPSKIVDYARVDVPILAFGSGPWRSDSRLPAERAETTLASLKRGDPRNCAWRAPTAAETANQLLQITENAVARPTT